MQTASKDIYLQKVIHSKYTNKINAREGVETRNPVWLLDTYS